MGATLLGFGRRLTVTVIPEIPGGAALAWAFDCVQSMTETLPGQAFRHRLQNGQEGIIDGTRLEPPEFQVEGIVTDTPVRFLLPAVHPGAVALYEQIKAVRAQQVPVTVVSSLTGALSSRWPEVITGSHGADTGASIRISINFVHFRLVSTILIPAQVDSDVLLLGASTTTISQPAIPG